jgi:hypothetical protein
MSILAQYSIIPGVVNPMSSFYNEFRDITFTCYEALMPFVLVLAFAGLLLQVYKGMLGGSLEGMMGQILMTAVVATIMQFYGDWIFATQETIGRDLVADLGMDPMGIIENFGNSFADMDIDGGGEPDFLDMLGFIDPMAIIEYLAGIIASFLMIFVGIITYVLIFLAYQVQLMALYAGCAASPIFMGMILFEQTRETAIKYHIGMIAICFWPLGWALGLLFADGLLTAGTELIMLIIGPAFAFGAAAGLLTTVIAAVVLVVIVAAWIMFTVFKAPKIVQAALVSGTQIGMAFAGAAAGAISGGIGAGVGVASSAAGMIPGKAGEAASSAIGSVGGVASSMGSSAGSMGSGSQNTGDGDIS